MKKVTARFQVSFSTRGEIWVSKCENFWETTNADSDGREFIPTTVEFLTDDGMHVELMATGAYRIIETGEIGMCKL
jgi:hypothetical protein